MKHIMTFEGFSTELDNVEKIEEGLFTSMKKIVAKIAALTIEKSEDIKKVFIELFEEASSITDLSRKFWSKVKPLIDKMSAEEMLKILNQAKADYEATGKVGYVVEAGGKIGYKTSGAVKPAAGIGGHNFGEGA